MSLTALFLMASVAGSTETPNIIVIMADDLGYGDVGCYGALPANVKTPNIDRLANEGLRFTSGYCSNSTCTPSRYTLLTGQYAFRKSGTGIGGINSTLKIDENRTTLADMLKSAGYATAVIGKWHLGLGSGSAPDWNGVLSPGPLELGFDHCFLLPNTNDRVPSVYVEDHAVANLNPTDPLTVSSSQITNSNPYSSYPSGDLKYSSSHGHNNSVHNGVGRIGYFSGGTEARWRDEDMADDFINKALPWIEANTNTPFFLYFASQDCHVPRLPNERFHGKSELGWRGDAIVQVDWCVGQIIDKIEALGIATNTMILFCSDNGPVLDDGYNDDAKIKDSATGHAAAGPFRGGKYSVYEGGTRTPFITWWPGRITTNTVSDEIVCSMDLARSFSSLTGQAVSGDAFPDSFDVMDALLGVNNAKGRDHLIQANNTGSSLGFREGNWKIVGTSALYNLDSDPGEQINLAGENPEKLSTMVALRNVLTQSSGTASGALAAVAGYGSVHLDWLNSTATNVASYTVHRGTTSGGPYSEIASGLADSEYVDNDVSNGITYYYVVATAYIGGGQSPFGYEASASPAEFPSGSTNVVLEAEDSTIVDGNIKTLGSGWSGTAYVDLLEGGYVDFAFVAPATGDYNLEFNTAGLGNGMAAEIVVNGVVINPALDVPNTGSWNSSWEVVSATRVRLNSGTNTIRFKDNGNDQPQIDRLEMVRLLEGFAEWSNNYQLVNGPAGHDDADGLNNIYEYGLGGNPTNSLDSGYEPQGQIMEQGGSNWFVYVHPQRSDPASGISYKLELSNNLVSNIWSTSGYEVLGIEPQKFSPNLDAVTNRILITNEKQQFIRLLIEQL